MKSLRDLELEVSKLKVLLKTTLENAFHTPVCSYRELESPCTCYVQDAWDALQGTVKGAVPKPTSDSRSAGTKCLNCKCSSQLHTCIIDGKLACAGMNCDCQEFVDSGLPVESHWK